MSGICGWLHPGRPASTAIVETLAQSLTGSRSERVHNAAGVDCAVAGRASAAKLHIHSGDGLLAIAIGRPRLANARAAAAVKALAAGFRDVGPAVLNDLNGHFALAVLDESRREALLAVDRMGVESLCYFFDGGPLVFASNANAIRAHPDVEPGIDPHAIFNYLYFHIVPGPNTVFRKVHRLPPGCCLHLGNGKARMHAFWQPDFDAPSGEPYKILRDRFHQRLSAAVKEEMSEGEVGTFLSGGTDSSTVTGIAQQHSSVPVKAYSIGFEAQGYDEIDYARTAARHFGVDHHEYYITPQDIVTAIPLIAESYEQPFGNSSAVPTYFCARLAQQHGTTRLLAGDGGDELFGGNERYAKQLVFSVYDAIPEPLRRSIVQPLADAIPVDTRITLLHKFRRYVEQASIAMPMRMETYNLLHHLGLNEVLEADFLSSVDKNEPQRLLQDRYQRVPARDLINRMLALDFAFTLADNDLPKVTRMCDVAGMDVAFPLLNDELVAFSLQLSPRHKLANTRLRPFFKRALNDFLPRKIIKKSKHGFGLPFGVWLHENSDLRDLANAALESLKQRGIIRPVFIDALLNERMPEHPGYYGGMVWVLTMLEYWFQKQVDISARVQRKAS